VKDYEINLMNAYIFIDDFSIVPTTQQNALWFGKVQGQNTKQTNNLPT
jgi:hypothetical protein